MENENIIDDGIFGDWNSFLERNTPLIRWTGILSYVLAFLLVYEFFTGIYRMFTQWVVLLSMDDSMLLPYAWLNIFGTIFRSIINIYFFIHLLSFGKHLMDGVGTGNIDPVKWENITRSLMHIIRAVGFLGLLMLVNSFMNIVISIFYF